MENKMDNIRIPRIEGLENCKDLEEFRAALDAAGVKGSLDCLNWPEWPEKPSCRFSLGWCREGLGILFDVEGRDLRARALEDNGSVWEDSCCELFIADPEDGPYYNFELNCIGTLLAAKRKSRSECRHLDPPSLNKVLRFSTLPREEIEIADEVMKWSNGMFIPFSLIGIDGSNPPETLRLNIYKCGDKTAHPHFLSWAPIHMEKPDFHRPEFFGTAIIER